MENAFYTLGPWHVAGWHGGLVNICEEPRLHVAVFTSTYKAMVCPCGLADDAESVSTARLIATAPELVEVLCNLIADVETLTLSESSLPSLTKARAILSKARGNAQWSNKTRPNHDLDLWGKKADG